MQLEGEAESELIDVSKVSSVNELFDIIAESELDKLKEDIGLEEWELVSA